MSDTVAFKDIRVGDILEITQVVTVKQVDREDESIFAHPVGGEGASRWIYRPQLQASTVTIQDRPVFIPDGATKVYWHDGEYHYIAVRDAEDADRWEDNDSDEYSTAQLIQHIKNASVENSFEVVGVLQ